MAQRTKKICSIDGCKNKLRAHGRCDKHYPEELLKRKPECSIEGCELPSKIRGWCQVHYSQWYNTGTTGRAPLTVKAGSPEKALKMRTKRQGDCLVWTGSKDGKGYGKIRVHGAIKRVHHYTWERENGPVPEGMFIDHICWNTSCHNVDHLRIASASENASYLKPSNRKTATGIRNVTISGSKYVVQLGKNMKRHVIGRYDSLEEAAEVAEQARQEFFGDFAGFSEYEQDGKDDHDR